MVKRVDVVGKRYGSLVVVAEAESVRYPTRVVRRVECVCDCGKTHVVNLQSLSSGNTTSCGCTGGNYKHGHNVGVFNKEKTRSTTYTTWQAMHQRCENPKHSAYPRYGGAGVSICERWRGADGFKNFLTDMGERPMNMTLDRIENNLGYSPENCRWATSVEQYENKRVTRDHHGKFTK